VPQPPTRRTLVLASLAAAAVPKVGRAAAGAAELLYIHEPGCPFCRRFEATIAPIYPASPEARRAPLRAIELRDAHAEPVTFARPLRVTPTFVLVAEGREFGRLEGFASEDMFWGLLANLIERLPRAL
jgi:hypothetical protein